MDVYRLVTFCRVFEFKSFSKAAQDLLLSQPTVSSHIANLENELGVSLFDRVAREIIPTQAGSILYDYALKIIGIVNTAITEIQTIQGMVAGDLYIGGSTIPGQYFLPDVLHIFKQKFPDVCLHLQIHDSSCIQELVRGGHLDVGVVGGSEEHPDLITEPLMADELVILGSKSLCIPTQRDLDRDSLASLPWIIREKGSGTRKSMETWFSKLDLHLDDLKIVAIVHSTEAVLQCIRAGMGVSITSHMAATRLIQSNECVLLSIPWMTMNRSFYMVSHRQRQIFQSTQKFMDILRAYCQQMHPQTVAENKDAHSFSYTRSSFKKSKVTSNGQNNTG
jgi:DNA-binding transcriptional LysR family regulator